MFDELFLTHEQQVKKSHNKRHKLDLRAYKGGGEPAAPEQKKETYSAFGNVASQDGFTASPYNQKQMDYYQGIVPTLQSQLYDQNTGEQQATNYAQNIKDQGMRSFKRDMADSLGTTIADNARRFGSLNNSSYDSGLKRFTQAQEQGLQDLNNNYDANKMNYMNDYTNRYTNLLNNAQNGIGNLYNLANGQSQNALSSSNATNTMAQQLYQTQASMYNTQQQANAAMASAAMSAAGNMLKPNVVVSDIKTKKNINKIDEINGINIYEFEYKTNEYPELPIGKQVGVIAQEVEKLIPDSVINTDRYKMVDYSKVLPLIA